MLKTNIFPYIFNGIRSGFINLMGLDMSVLFMNPTLLTASGQFKYVYVFIYIFYKMYYLFNDSLAFLPVGNHYVSYFMPIKQSSRLLGKPWDIPSMHASGTSMLRFVIAMVLVEENL